MMLDDMEIMDASGTGEVQRSPEEVAATVRESIRQTLAWRLRDAIQARESSGIEEIWIEDGDQYDGYDDLNPPPTGRHKPAEEPRSAVEQTKASRIYLNITKPKVESMVSRVQEMILPHDERPWTVEPTPVPSLIEAAATEDDRTVPLGDGTIARRQDVAKAALIRAGQAAERMSDQINDWFVEGSTYSHARGVVRSAARLGSGVIKGPFPVAVTEKRWDITDGQSVMQVSERIVPATKEVSCWDLYPDPSCGEDIHNGGYVYERDYLTARSLRKLAKAPGYDKHEVAAVLKEGPRPLTRTGQLAPAKPGETQQQDRLVFEVFYYYGDIDPRELLSTGYRVAGFNDAQDPEALASQIEEALELAVVNIVATIINERIVKVSLNPLETGDFPFSVLPWEPVEGQVWGLSATRKIGPAQRMLNASARAMMENAGMSKGPQIVINKKRVKPANGRYEIAGRKLWFDTGDDPVDIRFLFQSHMIQSAQPELMAIIKLALEMSDIMSNLPLMMQGQVGAAPDTLGGMQMLEANASSPLKSIAKLLDDRVIGPMLKRFYAWAMQDPAVPSEAKGDMQCKPLGSQSLVQREAAAMFMQQSSPLVKDPSFRINPAKWFEKVAKANRFSASDIQYTDDEWRAVQEQSAKNVPQDPRVQAAQIMQQTRAKESEDKMRDSQAERDWKASEAAQGRQAEAVLKNMDLQIQALQFSNNRNVSTDQIRAMLTKAIIESRDKRELFAAERNFAETEGQGRGL